MSGAQAALAHWGIDGLALGISVGGSSNTSEWHRAAEWVDRADEAGLHSVWMPEMHFLPGASTSPLLSLAAFAARTRQIRLATTSLLIPIHHPLRIAEEVAALDHLSRGRTIIGLGRGFRAPLFSAFGIDPSTKRDRFDAALEEVLHLITTAGYAQVYPAAFGAQAGTLLTDAMDLARGGRFQRIPNPYPEGAWYHYDDATCDYRCMAVEYFYWALTTLLGAQAEPARCREINREWTLCTAMALEEGDPAVHALLTDPQYHLPTRLPDGRYAPALP